VRDLRTAEDALWRWMSATALVRAGSDGGVVMVAADASIPTVQALIRWDPVGHAKAELTARADVGLPPAVHIAAVDGTPNAVREMMALLEEARLPDGSDVLGPVDLPAGVRRPPHPVTRMLVRVPREQGPALAAGLRHGVAVLSARQTYEPVRVQIDLLHIG